MLVKIKNLYLQFGYSFPLLIAFLLPFGINYATILIAWTACYLFLGNPLIGFKAVFRNPWSYILLSFFFLHVVAYWFSNNKQEALTSIEVKMSFFAFPLLVFCIKYNAIEIKKILISFVTGCLISALICFFKALFLYFFNHINAFFYSDFSLFLHPSYFAMYLILAQLIVMLYYKEWLGHILQLNYKIGFITVVFVASIFFASSKMGLISAFLLLPSTFGVILYIRGYKKTIIGLIGALVLGICVVYKLFPSPFERIKVAFTVTSSSEQIDKTASESTAVRILIWKEALKLIKDYTIFGVTPGDTNDRLYKAYNDNGMTGALEKKLNAHNQYLQTFIGTGLPGIILLCIITLSCIVFGILRRNYILMLFSVLITFNFLVESMLQTQAGTVFFAFFLCVFLQYNLSKFHHNPKLPNLL